LTNERPPHPILSRERADEIPAGPQGVRFIPLREAVWRSGIPPETLARKCRGEWAEMNLAMILQPEDGGKPCWQVREDADGRFARIKRLYLMPKKWTVAKCYDYASQKFEEEGREVPFGYSRAKQILRTLDPKVVAFHRLGCHRRLKVD